MSFSLPGHGFKLAPAVGKAVSELVLRKPPSYKMSPFAISRFSLPSANLWESSITFDNGTGQPCWTSVVKHIHNFHKNQAWKKVEEFRGFFPTLRDDYSFWFYFCGKKCNVEYFHWILKGKNGIIRLLVLGSNSKICVRLLKIFWKHCWWKDCHLRWDVHACFIEGLDRCVYFNMALRGCQWFLCHFMLDFREHMTRISFDSHMHASCDKIISLQRCFTDNTYHKQAQGHDGAGHMYYTHWWLYVILHIFWEMYNSHCCDKPEYDYSLPWLFMWVIYNCVGAASQSMIICLCKNMLAMS